MGEFAGTETSEDLVKVFFECWCILDGESKLWEAEGAIDAKFEDLV